MTHIADPKTDAGEDHIEAFAVALSRFVAISAWRIAHHPGAAAIGADESQAFATLKRELRAALAAQEPR